MKYFEFFQKFYMGRSAAAITGHKSKEKIPEYIMKAGLADEWHYVLPVSGSSYAKWMSTTTSHRDPEGIIWGTLVSHFDEGMFIDNLSRDLNDSTLGQTMLNFRIALKKDETPDKRLFAYALAKQFYAIVQGSGDAEDEMKKFYNPTAHIRFFPKYQERATEKYSTVRLPFSDDDDERKLEEIYVCNKLSSRIGSGEARRRTVRSSRAPEIIIESATLPAIADYAKQVALIAIGGMGKSMMLQHLFLDSIKRHLDTGILPIMVELRDFSEENDLFIDYILKSVMLLDATFTEKEARELMISGKCQILLDAADEIDQSDAKAFQRQLFDVMDRYPHNMYVIASRECDMVRGLKNRFKRLYLKPFEKGQSEELIEKLLPDERDEELRVGINEYLEEEFIQRHNIFKTNPMLLTFVIMKFPLVETFYGKKYLFYHTAYDTMVRVHDREKEAYDRIYHSAFNSEEFTMVFREFCAVTYRDRVHEFDHVTFEEYFKKLTSIEKLDNKKIMTKDNFIHDSCATTCMMYEADLKILYIDPGFQEYLFAEYNYLGEPEKIIEFGRKLWNIPLGAFDDDSAFDMFCEFSMDKVEIAYFIPFLNEIFKGKTDEAAFVSFLKNGYKKIDYQVVNSALIAKYMAKEGAEWQPLKPAIAEPSNVVFSMILKQAEVDGLLCFAVFEKGLNYPNFMTAGIYGEDFYDGNEKKRKIVAKRVFRPDVENLSNFEKTHSADRLIRDGDEQLICFGYEYKADFSVVEKAPENYQSLIEVLKTENEDVWSGFCRVKVYYEKLIEKHADSGISYGGRSNG